jgi:hypothetical protein
LPDVKEHDAMQETDIHTYARQLMEMHGTQAIAKAAQRAVECEAQGEPEQAKTWRHVEDALKIMRGPHQS